MCSVTTLPRASYLLFHNTNIQHAIPIDSEVRRAALLQVPLTPSTLSAVLSRTRDTDALTRKLVYSAVLQSKLGHPRQLTIAQREQIVKDGLGDREPGVRVAAGKMVASWFDMVLTETDEAADVTWIGDDGGIMKGFVKFLSLFDVVGPGEAVAIDAMLSIFVTRPDISDVFIFPGWSVPLHYLRIISHAYFH
jgi:condensin complex subunit 3